MLEKPRIKKLNNTTSGNTKSVSQLNCSPKKVIRIEKATKENAKLTSSVKRDEVG
jgi:hypothetical protein